MDPIFERSSANGYQENYADIKTLRGLANSIEEAVAEYQVSPDILIALRMRC